VAPNGDVRGTQGKNKPEEKKKKIGRKRDYGKKRRGEGWEGRIPVDAP